MQSPIDSAKFKEIVQSLDSYKTPLGIQIGGGMVVFFHPNQRESMREMLELTEEQFNARVFIAIEVPPRLT